MSMSDPIINLGSICYQSEPSEVPYSTNQFLDLDFFCHFLQLPKFYSSIFHKTLRTLNLFIIIKINQFLLTNHRKSTTPTKKSISKKAISSTGVSVGHFECLCREFDFYKAKGEKILFLKKRREVLLHF